MLKTRARDDIKTTPLRGRQAGKDTRDTRSIILETALKHASREGIDGLTIGELAKAVGMSKSGLFAHFGGRAQLQLGVLKLALDHFVNLVLRPAFKAPRGAPRIEAVFNHWPKHLNDRSSLPGSSVLIAASTEFDDRPGLLRDFVQKAQKALIANIEKAAQMAVEEGHFKTDLNTKQFAWSMYSYVLGYYHSKRMLDDPKAEHHLKYAFNQLFVSAQRTERAPNKKIKTRKRSS